MGRGERGRRAGAHTRTKEHLNNQGAVSTSQGQDREVPAARQVAEAQSRSPGPPGRAGGWGSTLEVPEPGQEEGGWVDHRRSDRRGKRPWEPQVPRHAARRHTRR